MTQSSPSDFEGALEQLEKLVEQLESGNLPLEKSLSCYEEGKKLVSSCRDILDKAEQRIAILTEDDSGATQIAAAIDQEGEIQAGDDALPL